MNQEQSNVSVRMEKRVDKHFLMNSGSKNNTGSIPKCRLLSHVFGLIFITFQATILAKKVTLSLIAKKGDAELEIAFRAKGCTKLEKCGSNEIMLPPYGKPINNYTTNGTTRELAIYVQDIIKSTGQKNVKRFADCWFFFRAKVEDVYGKTYVADCPTWFGIRSNRKDMPSAMKRMKLNHESSSEEKENESTPTKNQPKKSKAQSKSQPKAQSKGRNPKIKIEDKQDEEAPNHIDEAELEESMEELLRLLLSETANLVCDYL